jgi:phosphohistidine phosphatase SixA
MSEPSEKDTGTKDSPFLRVECYAGYRADSEPRRLHIGPEGQAQAHAGLAPNDPLEKLSPEIAFWSLDTLIVGHLPYLGRLASLLLASDPDRPLLAFQPGGMACLEKDAEGQWVLAWMVRPELLAPARG